MSRRRAGRKAFTRELPCNRLPKGKAMELSMVSETLSPLPLCWYEKKVRVSKRLVTPSKFASCILTRLVWTFVILYTVLYIPTTSITFHSRGSAPSPNQKGKQHYCLLEEEECFFPVFAKSCRLKIHVEVCPLSPSLGKDSIPGAPAWRKVTTYIVVT